MIKESTTGSLRSCHNRVESDARHHRCNLPEEDYDMKNLFFEQNIALVSAVGTMEAIVPSDESAPGGIDSRRTAGRIPDKARSWYQRLLEVAAHNPPHPL